MLVDVLDYILYCLFPLSPLLSFPMEKFQIFYFKIMGRNQMICLGPGPLRLQNKNKAEEVSALLGAVSDTSTSRFSAALSAALSQQHSGET